MFKLKVFTNKKGGKSIAIVFVTADDVTYVTFDEKTILKVCPLSYRELISLEVGIYDI